MTRFSKLLSVFFLTLAAAVPVLAQPPQAAAGPPDPQAELQRINGLISAAAKAVQAGGEDPAARAEVRRRALELWEYGRKHPDQPAGAKATAGAIHLLVALKLDAEAREKVDGVGPLEPAWKWIPDTLLFDQAGRTGDYDYVIRKMQALIEAAPEPAQRGRFRLALGLALESAGRLQEAEKALVETVAELPGTRQAAMAEKHLHEIRSLNVGQAAPAFTAVSTAGERISLPDLEGKIVLLGVWASY